MRSEKPQPSGVTLTRIATAILIVFLIVMVIEIADATLNAQARATNEARWKAQIHINELTAQALGLDESKVQLPVNVAYSK